MFYTCYGAPVGLAKEQNVASEDDERKPKDSDEALEKWWEDLAKQEPLSTRAILKFASQPTVSVPFFKMKLKPLKLDKERLAELIDKLGNDDEPTWKGAFEELEYFDPRLAEELETLMKDVTQAPARQRLVEVMSGRPAGSLANMGVELSAIGEGPNKFFNFRSGNGSWWAEAKVSNLKAGGWGNQKAKWTRAIRAMIVLEHIDHPDAMGIVKFMAVGHSEAEPTVIAREIAFRREKP